MQARRGWSKSAVGGLRSVQALGALAVPATLYNVPEEEETILGASKSEHRFRTDDWKSVQESVKKIFTEENSAEIWEDIYYVHQKIENILRSKTGTFLPDYYKQELLSKEMSIISFKLYGLRGSELLKHLERIWINFFTRILPTLEVLLYLVKPKGRVTIRTTTLAAFRDDVLLTLDVEDALSKTGKEFITPEIKQMLLVLQNVTDSYPPNKNKLRMESLTSLACSPFLGYFGLYNEKGKLTMSSNEPIIASKRRPSADIGGLRRVSRPFSVQSLQVDTLNQIFINAIRSKQDA